MAFEYETGLNRSREYHARRIVTKVFTEKEGCLQHVKEVTSFYLGRVFGALRGAGDKCDVSRRETAATSNKFNSCFCGMFFSCFAAHLPMVSTRHAWIALHAFLRDVSGWILSLRSGKTRNINGRDTEKIFDDPIFLTAQSVDYKTEGLPKMNRRREFGRTSPTCHLWHISRPLVWGFVGCDLGHSTHQDVKKNDGRARKQSDSSNIAFSKMQHAERAPCCRAAAAHRDIKDSQEIPHYIVGHQHRNHIISHLPHPITPPAAVQLSSWKPPLVLSQINITIIFPELTCLALSNSGVIKDEHR